MILDAAVGGTIMTVAAEQATRIIDVLASTDYQAQHDRHTVKKKGVLDFSTLDTILAKYKILTQQIDALTKQMSKLPQQLHAVNSSSIQNQALKCDFCGGDHLNGQCFYQNPSKEEVQYMNNQGRQGDFSSNYPNNMAQGWRNNPNQGFGWKREGG